MNDTVAIMGTTASFLESIGIGEDLPDVKTAKWVADRLAYLGIEHLRTDYTDAVNLLAAGARGAKVDMITPWFLHPVTDADIKSMLTDVVKPAISVMEAIEGPNEVDYDPDTFNGVGGPKGFVSMQSSLYAQIKADPVLARLPVYDFTILQGTPGSDYANPGGKPLADYNNIHAYSDPGIPMAWVYPYELAFNRIAGDKPVVMTETGATTISNDQGVNEAVQARTDVEALLVSYALGTQRTYLFNMRDWETPAQTGTFSAHYGLYNLDDTPKLAATAIHNFTTILSRGQEAVSSPSSLPAYSVSGLPYYGEQLLLDKGGGKFDLALWTDRNYWDASSHQESALDTSNVTVKFGSVMSASVYDPLISTSPIAYSVDGQITVQLSKDPLIVEFGPLPNPATPSAPIISTTETDSQTSQTPAPVSEPSPLASTITSSTSDSASPPVVQVSKPTPTLVDLSTSTPVDVSLPEPVIIGKSQTSPVVPVPASVQPDNMNQMVQSVEPAAKAVQSTYVATVNDSTLFYRFFNRSNGGHFFTSDKSEADGLQDMHGSGYRSDLVLEHSDFMTAGISAQSSPNGMAVARLFDTSTGAHFFTADAGEAKGLVTPGSATYRADLIMEKADAFHVHRTAEAGDVAVYRFWDKNDGSHFFTGNAGEAAAMSGLGSAGYRPDMVSEGIAFWAPAAH